MELFLVFASLFLNAAQERAQLSEIVITGTRTEKVVSDAPVKADLISQKTIEEEHYTDLKDAVENLPGVTLQSEVGRTGQSAVIQGLGEDHVLVLRNGVPRLQKSSSGFDLSSIPTHDIERIEVVKGGASSLYGSQAIGGVINIITKKPSQKSAVVLESRGAQLTRGSASQPAIDLNGQLSGQAAGYGYKFSASRRARGSHDNDPQTVVEDIGSFEKSDMVITIDKKLPSNWESEFEYSANQQNNTSISSMQMPSGAIRKLQNTGNATSQSAMFGVKNRNFSSRIQYEVIRDRLALNDDPNTSFLESEKSSIHQAYYGELIWTKPLSNSHLLTSGLVLRSHSLNQEGVDRISSTIENQKKEIDQKHQSSTEIFVQDEIFLNGIEIIPGLRAQQEDGFGTHISPKIAVHYQIERHFADVHLRGSVASGYRSPSLKERFYLLDHSSFGTPYIVEGNETLEPETSLSYQVGLELNRPRRWRIYTDVFSNQVTNMIETVNGADQQGIQIYRYENYKEVRSIGFEMGTGYEFSNGIHIRQNWARTETQDSLTGLSIVGRPVDTLGISLAYRYSDSFQTSIQYKFTGESFTDPENTEISPSYSTVDFKANYKVSPTFRLFSGINNVLDVRRDPLKDIGNKLDFRPSVGRMAYIGINIRN